MYGIAQASFEATRIVSNRAAFGGGLYINALGSRFIQCRVTDNEAGMLAFAVALTVTVAFSLALNLTRSHSLALGLTLTLIRILAHTHQWAHRVEAGPTSGTRPSQCLRTRSL